MYRLSFEEEKIKDDFRQIDEFVDLYMKEAAEDNREVTVGLYRGTIKLMYTYLMMCSHENERHIYNLARTLSVIVRSGLGGRCPAGYLINKGNFENHDIDAYLTEHQIESGSVREILKARNKVENGWSQEEYREFEKCLERPVKEQGDGFEKNFFRGGLTAESNHSRKDNDPVKAGDGSTGRKSKSNKPDPLFIDECRDFLKKHTPRSIKQELDKYIIGQDDAKKLISLAVYNHYQRICHPEQKLKKCNILMAGPSGCGKTEIVRRLKEMLNVPVVLADFSCIVSTPYKGRNKEEELIRLYREADGHVGNASCGIMFLDEFDKICSPNGSRGRDFSDELMGQLLGMFEGTLIDTSAMSSFSDPGERFVIDTSNILFVCMGAFEGLSDIVRKDLRERSMENEDSLFGLPGGSIPKDMKIQSCDVRLEHLIEYGIKPELAGRLCNLALLDPADAQMMKKILTDAMDSPLQRLKNELELDDVKLKVTDGALDMIVDRALKKDIGARALNTVLREIFDDVLFRAPSLSGSTVILTEKGIIFEKKYNRKMEDAIGL